MAKPTQVSTLQNPEAGAIPTRSRFVTVIAWLTIIASVLLLLLLPLVIAALSLLAPAEAGALRNAVLMFGAACVLQLVMGVGLLQRRNWARLLMVISLAAVAAWQAVDLLTSDGTMPPLPEPFGSDPAMAELLVTANRAMVVLGLVLIVGSLWAMYRFTRADIRREFGALQ